MARGNTSVSKRLKERQRAERKQAKAERREQRRAELEQEREQAPSGVDPDIAHIVPGPQPSPFEDDDAESDATDDAE